MKPGIPDRNDRMLPLEASPPKRHFSTIGSSVAF